METRTFKTHPLKQLFAQGFVLLLVALTIATQGRYPILNLYAGTLGGIFFFANASCWTFFQHRQQLAFRTVGIALFLIALIAAGQIVAPVLT